MAGTALLSEEAFPFFGQAGQLIPGWLRGNHGSREHQCEEQPRNANPDILKHCLTSLSGKNLTKTVLICGQYQINFNLRL
jgi:hypothetical protein